MVNFRRRMSRSTAERRPRLVRPATLLYLALPRIPTRSYLQKYELCVSFVSNLMNEKKMVGVE